MLATLERPTDRPADRSLFRTVHSPACSPPAPLRLVRLAPAVAEPASAGPAPAPRMAPRGPRVDRPAGVRPLRMTVRARRLLAGLALLAGASVGVVAVDVLAELIPFTPSSYAAQEAPYGGVAGSGGFVPAAASSVTVEAGDTLWSLAQRLDPQADPREVIAAIMTLNGLDTPTLQPGQVLLLP